MYPAALLDELNPWWRDPSARARAFHPFARDGVDELWRRLGSADRALLLVGPRQVGKTWILRHLADRALDEGFPPGNVTIADFSDPRLPNGVVLDDVFEALPTALNPALPRLILLDEVASLPRWSELLRHAVDRLRRGVLGGPLHIIATDSAAGLLRRGAAESGEGRFVEIPIEGLTFREFLRLRAGPDVDADVIRLFLDRHLSDYLERGGLPAYALREADLVELRRDLREDIADRAITRDLAALNVDVEGVRRLLVYLLRSSGAVFSRKERAQDVGSDPRSVASWLRLLEQSRLIVALDPQSSRATVRLRGKPKWYAFDHGLVNAFSLALEPAKDPWTRGRRLEAAVYRHLRHAVRQRALGEITYLQGHGTSPSRNADDTDLDEVDFMVSTQEGPILLEVKAGSRVKPEAVAGVSARARESRASKALIVYGGATHQSVKDVGLVPLLSFLLDPVAILAAGRSAP